MATWQRSKLVSVVLLSVLLVTSLWPLTSVKAATASYYFSPSSLKLNANQTATVTLYVSSPDQALNAADGTVVLPETYLSGSSINKSGSIFTTWPEEPTVNGSSIRFAGGLPTPGYKGSSGKLFSFTVKGKAEGTGLITLNGGRILANDASSSNLFSGTSNATVTVTKTTSAAAISSSTHPDQNKWYFNKTPAVSWSKPSGTTKFNWQLVKDGAVNQKNDSTTLTSASFNNLSEGVWEFKLTTTFDNGKTADSSFTIRIDVTPPLSFAVNISQQGGAQDAFPVLTFAATDQLSGIDHYSILVDEKEIATTSETTYKLARQLPGNHRITVKAVDKAGNTTEATAQLSIEGFAPPVIISFPPFVSTLQGITFTGKALYGTTVRLYVDGTVATEFVVKETLKQGSKFASAATEPEADTEVEWTYTYSGILFPGKHTFYSVQVKPDGSESNRSNEVTVLVLASKISVGGLNLPMALVAALLGVLLIGVSTLLLLLWRRSKGWFVRLRQRTQQAETEIATILDETEEKIEATLDSVKPPREVYKQIEAEVDTAEKSVNQKLEDIADNKHR